MSRDGRASSFVESFETLEALLRQIGAPIPATPVRSSAEGLTEENQTIMSDTAASDFNPSDDPNPRKENGMTLSTKIVMITFVR